MHELIALVTRSTQDRRIYNMALLGHELANFHRHTSSSRYLLVSMVEDEQSLPGTSAHAVRIHLHVTPLRQLYETFREALPIAEAEMAAALYGLLWKTRLYRNPFRVTLYTDSSVVFYTRYTGKGYTLRSQQLLP